MMEKFLLFKGLLLNKSICVLSISILLITSNDGQIDIRDHLSTEDYIVCYRSDYAPNAPQQLSHPQIIRFESIFRALNLWHITVVKSPQKNAIISSFEKNKNVRYIHKSIIATNRAVPNDPDFSFQWSLPIINMEEAWDITSGGKNAAGHDIVVGILDDGYQINHPDLAGSIWTNTGEIEDNGIDDDGNGFVDDVFGWNALAQDDNHLVASHGTSVAGIIGAQTNNDNQMAGINWDVKLMLTSSGSPNGYALPLIVKSYEYIFEQRKTYNETQGAAGAYVVATNYSGGVEDRFPEDFPSWCEVYDALGSVGIINIGSTANNDKNVDVLGDLPSTCTSDFLIVTTNSDRLNRKVDNAGYSTTHIDLAAPGDDIYSISQNDGIDQSFFGTSASAPHVAGVASLMYAVMCEEAYQQSLNDPASIALIVKGGILDQVSPSSSLANFTATGGVLNALGSIQTMEETIGDCCSITISDLNATAESCANADDGILEIIATGEDLSGNLSFTLSGTNFLEENALGNFNRLPAQSYVLAIVDDLNPQCVTDTTLVIEERLDICPFGLFEIAELRHDNIAGRLIVAYDLDEQKDIHVQIHDSAGRLIYDQFVSPLISQDRTHEVRTADFPLGIYHASILANGIRDVASFVVVR